MIDIQTEIEKELTETLGKAIQEEMDFSILADIMCSFGWTKVVLARFDDNKHAVDIAYWCEENVKHEWKNYGSHFIFENSGDAVNFTLKWQ